MPSDTYNNTVAKEKNVTVTPGGSNLTTENINMTMNMMNNESSSSSSS